MKHLQLIGLIVCGAILISCETPQTTGMGNQEQKRLAAVRQQQEDAQMETPTAIFGTRIKIC